MSFDSQDQIKSVSALLEAAQKSQPRSDLKSVGALLEAAQKSQPRSDLKSVGALLEAAQKSQPRSDLKSVGALLEAAQKSQPRSDLKSVGALLEAAQKSQPKGLGAVLSAAQKVKGQEQTPRIVGLKEQALVELSKSIRNSQGAGTGAPLSELAVLAQTLNSESNELNATIQTLNEKLRALNFGVEVWCEEADDLAFGYSRLGDPSEWQLAARSASANFTTGKKEYRHDPLLKRNRNERIQGLEHVPEILAKLKEDAEYKVAAIRKAKDLAASL